MSSWIVESKHRPGYAVGYERHWIPGTIRFPTEREARENADLGESKSGSMYEYRVVKVESDPNIVGQGKSVKMIIRHLPDGTLWVAKEDDHTSVLASWNPKNRPDATEKSRVGGYIYANKVDKHISDDKKEWLDAVEQEFDLNQDEFISESWQGGGMGHKRVLHEFLFPSAKPVYSVATKSGRGTRRRKSDSGLGTVR